MKTILRLSPLAATRGGQKPSGGLKKAGAGKVFRELALGNKTDRAQLGRLLDKLAAGDVLMC